MRELLQLFEKPAHARRAGPGVVVEDELASIGRGHARRVPSSRDRFCLEPGVGLRSALVAPNLTGFRALGFKVGRISLSCVATTGFTCAPDLTLERLTPACRPPTGPVGPIVALRTARRERAARASRPHDPGERVDSRLGDDRAPLKSGACATLLSARWQSLSKRASSRSPSATIQGRGGLSRGAAKRVAKRGVSTPTISSIGTLKGSGAFPHARKS